MTTVLLSCRLCGDEVRRARARRLYTHLASLPTPLGTNERGARDVVGRSMGFFDVLGLGAAQMRSSSMTMQK